MQNTDVGDFANLSYSVSGDFTLIVSPLTSLGPDIAVSFYVSFTPLTAGYRTATISIFSNDRDENPFVIPIDATAIAPEIVVEEAGTPLETGQVVVVGSNVSHQRDVPAGLNGVKALAAGSYFTLALRGNGTVAAWGDTTVGPPSVPEDLRNVVAIAGGSNHSLALKSDGTVVAWGATISRACTAL